MESSIQQSVKDIQKLELDILSEFIDFCNRHKLRYYLIEGSLLGAVRHKGMIPWDDDIDVALFRDDYEVFMQTAARELPAHLEVQSHRNTDGYIECMTKLIDKRFWVTSDNSNAKGATNVWIDIFIIDGLPSSGIKDAIFRKYLLARKLMVMWSNLDHYVTSRKRGALDRFLIVFGQKLHLSKHLDTLKQLQRLDKAMSLYPVRKTGNTVNFISEYRFKTVFPTSAYGEGRMVPFDGLTVRIPDRSEDMLEAEYGDYMKLPPEEGRYKHKLTIVQPKEFADISSH